MPLMLAGRFRLGVTETGRPKGLLVEARPLPDARTDR